MQLKIEDLEKKVLAEFESQLNLNAESGSKYFTLAIAQVAAKISSITVQMVLEEFSQPLRQANED